eukprot:6484444-Amphidinium_carterae.1
MGTRGVPIGTGSPGTATGAPCGSASTLAEEPGPCRKCASIRLLEHSSKRKVAPDHAEAMVAR